jgi:DNA-binding CsgD family transcriptional regulator
MNGDEQLARRAFDCVAAMKLAVSVDDLSDAVAPMFEELGLPHFAISRFFRADRRPDVAVLAGQFHSGWSQRYTSANYVRHSVIAHELLRTRKPYSWEQVIRTREVDEAQRRIKQEARESGLGDGLFTPIRWLDGSHAAVVLGGQAPALDDALVRTSAEVLSAYYASETRRLLEPGKDCGLTPRQRECLAWVRQGKSSSAIAEILGLSAETVNEHLAEACRRLGVRTRVQAAVEASLAGLID